MPIEHLYSKDMAEWYDKFLCKEPETTAQLRFLKRLFKKHRVKSVLDVACGTGRHAIELRKAGFQVMGVDLEPGMIAYAKRRSKAVGADVEYKVQDMRKLNVKKKFDAVIILYTAFSYLTSNDDVLKALNGINKHLKKNGILIVDVGFGWPRLVQGRFKRKIVWKSKIGNWTYELTDKNRMDMTGNYMFVKSIHKRKIGTKRLRTLVDRKPINLRMFWPNELDLFYRMTRFRPLEFYGDFRGHKLSDKHHRRLISVARKL